MEKNGAAAKVLSWSRRHLKAAEHDPAPRTNRSQNADAVDTECLTCRPFWDFQLCRFDVVFVSFILVKYEHVDLEVFYLLSKGSEFFSSVLVECSVISYLLKQCGKSRRCCAMSWHPSKCPS